jgi:hypothetical protein
VNLLASCRWMVGCLTSPSCPVPSAQCQKFPVWWWWWWWSWLWLLFGCVVWVVAGLAGLPLLVVCRIGRLGEAQGQARPRQPGAGLVAVAATPTDASTWATYVEATLRAPPPSVHVHVCIQSSRSTCGVWHLMSVWRAMAGVCCAVRGCSFPSE